MKRINPSIIRPIGSICGLGLLFSGKAPMHTDQRINRLPPGIAPMTIPCSARNQTATVFCMFGVGVAMVVAASCSTQGGTPPPPCPAVPTPPATSTASAPLPRTGTTSTAPDFLIEGPLKLAPRPTTAEITDADLMTRLYIFADDSMMGRNDGTP